MRCRQRTYGRAADSAHRAADQGALSATCQCAYGQACSAPDQAAIDCALPGALRAAHEADQQRDQERSVHRVVPSDHAPQTPESKEGLPSRPRTGKTGVIGTGHVVAGRNWTALFYDVTMVRLFARGRSDAC